MLWPQKYPNRDYFKVKVYLFGCMGPVGKMTYSCLPLAILLISLSDELCIHHLILKPKSLIPEEPS